MEMEVPATSQKPHICNRNTKRYIIVCLTFTTQIGDIQFTLCQSILSRILFAYQEVNNIMDPPAYPVGDNHGKSKSRSRAFKAPKKPAKPTRLDDPFKPRMGRHLVWKDVQMTLKKTKGEEPPKVILDDVWGEVPKGQVTAIMGPSGSGYVYYLTFFVGYIRWNDNTHHDLWICEHQKNKLVEYFGWSGFQQ